MLTYDEGNFLPASILYAEEENMLTKFCKIVELCSEEANKIAAEGIAWKKVQKLAALTRPGTDTKERTMGVLVHE